MATVSARPLADTDPQEGGEGRHRVLLRPVRGHERQALGQARADVNWEDLVTEGAGFAGFAAGPIGQTPASPDMMAIPDLRSYTPVPFKPGLARFACDITVRGRGVAVLPAHDPAPPARAGQELGYTFKVGMELEFFLLRETRGRRHRAGRPARPARPALLRHEGPDPPVRVPLRALAQRQRAGLGQLRQRPRGRQRPVRVELRVRRRPDHGRPGDLLPLHGARDGPGARACWPRSWPSRSAT